MHSTTSGLSALSRASLSRPDPKSHAIVGEAYTEGLLKRRRHGIATELILKALAECEGSISAVALRKNTGLAMTTVRENLVALRRKGEVETFHGDDGKLWVAKPS
jgi:hypothetical protein